MKENENSFFAFFSFVGWMLFLLLENIQSLSGQSKAKPEKYMTRNEGSVDRSKEGIENGKLKASGNGDGGGM